MHLSIVASLLAILSLVADSSAAAPSRRLGLAPVPMGFPAVKPRNVVASPRANAHPPRSNSAFQPPALVPMPFVRPRETHNQLGDLDEQLEECDESNAHDCHVGHEKERAVERRAELSDSAQAVERGLRDRAAAQASASRMLVRRR